MQIELVDQDFQFIFLLSFRELGHFQYGFDIVFYRKFAENRWLLWQITNPSLGSFVHGQVGDFLVVEVHFTFVGLDKTNHHVEGCGFTSTIWPQQSHNFTLIDIDRNTFDDMASTVYFNEVIAAKNHNAFGS